METQPSSTRIHVRNRSDSTPGAARVVRLPKEKSFYISEMCSCGQTLNLGGTARSTRACCCVGEIEERACCEEAESGSHGASARSSTERKPKHGRLSSIRTAAEKGENSR